MLLPYNSLKSYPITVKDSGSEGCWLSVRKGKDKDAQRGLSELHKPLKTQTVYEETLTVNSFSLLYACVTQTGGGQKQRRPKVLRQICGCLTATSRVQKQVNKARGETAMCDKQLFWIFNLLFHLWCVCFLTHTQKQFVCLWPGELHRWQCRWSAVAWGGLWYGSNLGESRTSPPLQSGLALWSAPQDLHNLAQHTRTQILNDY